MSQVKRSMEAHEELLKDINHHIECELDNDKDLAQEFLEQIEMSVDDHYGVLSRGNGGLYD